MIAVWRPPFEFAPRVEHMPAHLSLAEMAARMPGLPADFGERGQICVNGHLAPRALWAGIKPKEAVTEVTFHYAPRGGGDGGGGGKQVLTIVASVALAAAAPYFGAAVAGGLGFTAGTTGFAIASATAAGALTLAGGLIMSALSPPPSRPNLARPERPASETLGTASATGNQLVPNGAIPRVIGTRKIFPPLAGEPLVYYDGEDEVAEAVYCLAGPHKLEDIRVAGAPIEDVPDVEFQTREGWAGDADLTLVTRQSRTEQRRTELRGHTVEEDGTTLEIVDGNVPGALPQPTTFVTRDEPDEVRIDLVFPQGIFFNDDATAKYRVPLRLRIREIGGSTWVDLPELHYRGASVGEMRATIRLVWQTGPGTAIVSSVDGWCEARIAGGAWAADAAFDDGAGDDYLTGSNVLGSAVRSVRMGRHLAQITLDEVTFPKGRYEVEIKRGFAFRDAQYDASLYEIGGAVRDFYGYDNPSAPEISESQDGLVSTLLLIRAVSIWDEKPIARSGLALVALKARNRNLDQVSVLASGYVSDWDGSDWKNWATTSNPAPHLRDILAGALNADPLPLSVIDNAGLVSWRTACTDLGYTCDAIIEGESVADAAMIVAGAGYARPYMSDIWGVTRDLDRSGDAPVQVFTPRNSSGYEWEKAFANLPDGFRVTFPDKAQDYDASQITVYRNPAREAGGLTEQITYEGIVNEADARERAAYDLRVAQNRDTFHSLDAPAEAIVCRRGDLVGVQHDMLTTQAGAGRIIDWAYDGAGDVVSITLDDQSPFVSVGDVKSTADMKTVVDVKTLGLQTGVALRRTTGAVTTHRISSANGHKLTFDTPVAASGIGDGILAVIGAVGEEYQRMVIMGMTPRDELTWRITMVDEAPEIWA